MTRLKQYRAWFATILALIILALPFIFRPFSVTGGSMEPTYSEGQIVLVENLTPQFGVWRGEVLVIRDPHDKNVTELKRVVGLPDEDVTLGQNNVTVVHPSGNAETFGADTDIGRGQTGFFHMKLGPADYMVLGDNRSKSSDSRTFGAVQKPDIIGHVILKL